MSYFHLSLHKSAVLLVQRVSSLHMATPNQFRIAKSWHYENKMAPQSYTGSKAEQTMSWSTTFSSLSTRSMASDRSSISNPDLRSSVGVKLRVPHRPCRLARALLPSSLKHVLWEKHKHLESPEKLSSSGAIENVVKHPKGYQFDDSWDGRFNQQSNDANIQ